MPQYGTWVSYGGAARIVLAIVLVAAAGGVACAGILLPLPLRPARPGERAKAFMLVIWACGFRGLGDVRIRISLRSGSLRA
jgi:hypothetical protein